MAFGTGHHGTTLGCLRALDRLVSEGFVGAQRRRCRLWHCSSGDGRGKRFSAEPYWPVTSTKWRSRSPQANVAANGLAGRVRCIEATGFDHPDLQGQARFDLIFANILKGPLIDLAPSMAIASQPAGVVILSGILNEQADDVLSVYIDAGYNLVTREEIVEWTTLTLRRNTA